MDYIPLPNVAPNAQGFQNYSPNEGQVTKERYNAYTVKVDQVLTQNNRVSGSYVRNRRWQTGPYYGWPIPARGPNNFQRFNQGASAQWTSTLRPTLVVTSRFGFTQHDFGNFANGGGFDPTQLGFPADQVAQAQGKFFPGISFTDYTGFGGAGNSNDTSTNWYATVSANKVSGNHSIKFGGEMRTLFDNLPNYSFASFAFNKVFTQRDYANADALSGNAFASFLLGFPASGSSPYNASPALGNRYYGLYIQDDWKITPTLTVNIGGRWDYDSPTTERFNRINIGFDPNAPSSVQAPGLQLKGALLFASEDNRRAYKRDLNNFQPRVGMAWRIRPKTVFRSGFGISYVPQFVNPGSAGFSTSTPYVATIDANRTPAGRLSNPFPEGMFRPAGASSSPTLFAGQNLNYVFQDRIIPYIAQYSAGFQHELPWQTVVELSYVGSQMRNLGVSRNINDLTAEQLALGTTYLNTSVPNPMQGLFPGTAVNGPTVTRRTLLRPFPQYGDINRTQHSIGKGWYNSLQLQVEKRLSHGFHVLLNYTWSATMEAASYLHNQLSEDQLERTRVAEDLPHSLSILGGYQLPFYNTANGWKRAVFGGWQVQAIAQKTSGRQLNGVDAYWTGVSPFVDGPKVPDAQYFNGCTINRQNVRENCASATQPVVWIQRPADTLRVAGTRWPQIREMRPMLLNASAFKTFDITERVKAQFRFEAFNAFNTPWFGQANTALGNARFGLLGNSQTNDPRNTQAALKINF
jgi:hypothetical protein